MSKKLVIGLVVVALGLGLTISANAATVEELQALITSLQAQIAALSGGTTTGGSTTYAADLTIGSTGADVVSLQTFLEGKGMLVMPVGVAKGYFGPLTKAAVARYQASVGLPSTGYFGPLTRANLNSLVVVPPPVDDDDDDADDDTTLEGENGEIDDVDYVSAYSNEEVGDGMEDKIIAGWDIEASADGDIQLNSIKLEFDPTGNTGSDNMDDYIDSVSVWIGDEELGRADVDDFNESSSHIFSKSITLDNAIIRADEKERLLVKIDAVSNMDSSDVSGDSWVVNFTSARVEDGGGVVVTDSSTGDIGAIGGSDNSDIGIDFVSFSSAADTELTFSVDSGNPGEQTVIVSASADTDNVVLLKGKMRLEGTSDVVLDQLPVTFTVSGTSNTMDDLVKNAILVIDGEEYTESPSTSGTAATVTFDNLALTIEAGDTVEFEIRADIQEIDGDPAAEGDTLLASVSATNVDYVDVENEEGDQLADDTEKKGTVTGKTQTFRTSGVNVSFVSEAFENSETTGNINDLGTFTLKFKVANAGDDTIYVSSVVYAATTTSTTDNAAIASKVLAIVDRAGTATAGGVTVTLTNNTDTTKETSGTYAIEGGESENFTLVASVSLPAASDGTGGLYRLNLGGLYWSTVSTDATPDTAYTTNLGIGETVSGDSHSLN